MVKINKPKLEEEQKKEKRLSFKIKLILFLFFVILIESAAFFLYIKKIQPQLNQTNNYQELSQLINTETQRCNQTISQGEGQFSEYEYCTKFLNTFKDISAY